MKTNYLLTVFVLFGALLLAACSPKEAPALSVPEGAQAGDLTRMEACQYQPFGSKSTIAAECGTLTVPENWDLAGSRLISLPVVRIPARGHNPAEPVFWFEGGPGEPNLSWDPPAWLLEEHAVVMVGYRGVEGSTILTCPELGRSLKSHLGKDFLSEQAHAEYVAATRLCAQTHQQAGIDLSSYSIPSTVEDMEAARKALGYERINLFSQSYGTRVAQVYAYMHPESLHRSVLIGVNTPGHFILDAAALDEMVQYLSQLCAQDSACSSRTDDLAQTMYDVNHNMPKRWLFFNIDPDTVRLGALYFSLQNPDMSTVVDAYLAAGEGDFSGIAMANLLTVLLTPIDRFVYGEHFSVGATIELDRYRGYESISLENSIMGDPMAELGWPIAKDWPVELVSEDLRQLQQSNVEMLLVNGTIDLATPPTALDEARPYFHKAQMVLLPEFSHVQDFFKLQPEAFQRLVTSYYDTGVADKSLYVYQPLSFEPGMSLVKIARQVLAAMIAVAILLVLGVVLVVLRIRRRRLTTKSQVPVKSIKVGI